MGRLRPITQVQSCLPVFRSALCSKLLTPTPILWNPNFHHRTHNSMPHVPILSEIESTRSILRFRSILKSSFHLRLDHPSGLFPKVSPTQHCMHFTSPSTRATCLAHLFLRINSLSRKLQKKTDILLTSYSLHHKLCALLL